MRIVVAEDSVLFREGLTWVLADRGHQLVAAVGDATEIDRAVADHRPDLVIIDVRMPPDLESDGALAAVRLRERHPELGILLLSQHLELRHCLTLVGTPGFGYLLKDRVLDLDEFDAALNRVALGGSALDPEVVRQLVGSQRTAATGCTLTERETQVLALVAEGLSNSAIASGLGISERTVEAHMRAVFVKLGIDDDGGTHRRVRAVLAFLRPR